MTTSNARPRFKRSFRCEIVAEEGVFLLSETEQILLRGSLFCALAPLLDGEHPIENIFSSLQGSFPADRVFAALDGLRRDGYLAFEPAGERDGEAAFWELLGADAAAARSRPARRAVSVTALGGVEAAPLVDLLEAMGIHVDAAPSSDGSGVTGQLHLVVTDDYLRPELDAENRRSLAEGRPWVLVKPVGIQIWLGPFFVPDRTGCWACLAHRLRGHRKVEGYLQRRKGTDDPFGASLSALPSTRQTAFGVLATEAAKWVVEGLPSALTGKVLTLDARTLEQRLHVLVRRPQCPACGSPAETDPRAPSPLRLTSAPKRFTADGGHRSTSPEETFARLGHHLSPITGILGTLRPDPETTGVGLAPTYVADHSFAEMHTELYFLREGLRRRSGGKGMSDAQARASALGESIERYSGVFQGDEPRFRASRASLGDAAIHPNACMGYSEQQYRERDRWNARGTKVCRVPEPFDEARAIAWTPLWSLTAEAPRYLPTACCYYGAPEDEGGRFAVADSNGCAAGNTLEEAILQGFLELVERDAVAIWWYNRLRRPGVDLASFEEPYIARLQAHHRALGREVWALDVTSDLGIPAFAVVSRRADTPREDLIFGFGAHLDAKIALLRALTELNQSLPAVHQGGKDTASRYAGSSAEAIRWWSTATVENQPYLTPDPGAPPRLRAGYPPLAGDDLRDDVRRCVGITADRGMETLVLDQTRPDVGLCAVRVVVPGLRHFWARFGPGRLYEVPVAQGWRRVPTEESALNPWIVYF